jgi:hypothetical protein
MASGRGRHKRGCRRRVKDQERGRICSENHRLRPQEIQAIAVAYNTISRIYLLGWERCKGWSTVSIQLESRDLPHFLLCRRIHRVGKREEENGHAVAVAGITRATSARPAVMYILL